MDQNVYQIEEILCFWRQHPVALQIPPQIQKLFDELDMNPEHYKNLWKQRCFLGEGFAESFHPQKERAWSMGERGCQDIEKNTDTDLFVLKNLQDERIFSDIAGFFFDKIGGFVTVNLYWNHPNASVFPPHYDCHDVFVFQLFGSKNWFISPATEQKPTKMIHSQTPKYFLDTKQSTLEHAIYIPWGWWHHAKPTQHSIHLSIGIHEHPFFPISSSLE